MGSEIYLGVYGKSEITVSDPDVEHTHKNEIIVASALYSAPTAQCGAEYVLHQRLSRAIIILWRKYRYKVA